MDMEKWNEAIKELYPEGITKIPYSAYRSALYADIAEPQAMVQRVVSRLTLENAKFDVMKAETEYAGREIGVLLAEVGKLKLDKDDYKPLHMDGDSYTGCVFVFTPDEMRTLIGNIRRMDQAGIFDMEIDFEPPVRIKKGE